MLIHEFGILCWHIDLYSLLHIIYEIQRVAIDLTMFIVIIACTQMVVVPHRKLASVEIDTHMNLYVIIIATHHLFKFSTTTDCVTYDLWWHQCTGYVGSCSFQVWVCCVHKEDTKFTYTLLFCVCKPGLLHVYLCNKAECLFSILNIFCSSLYTR